MTLDAFLFFIEAAFNKKTPLVGFREIGCLAKPISAANSLLRYEKQHTPCVSKERAADLAIAGRGDKVSESSGRLAKTQRIEAKRTDSENQTG